MRLPFLLLIIVQFWIMSCDKKQDSNNEFNTEITEEATEAEVYEEVAPDINSQNQNSKSLYDLDTIPCKDEKGDLILSHIYQLKPWYIEKIENNSEKFYMSVLEWRYLLLDPARLCSNSSNSSWENINFFSENKFKGNNVDIIRDDLMPMIREEFVLVNPEFIDEMAEKMIPNPYESQYNGLQYQKLYDYFLKHENRNLYLAHFILEKYTYLEEEMKQYAINSSQVQVRPDETVGRFRSNYDDYMRHHFEYRLPYLGDYQVEETNFIKGYISFWLRRHLDGSYKSLLKAQEKVLKLYDPLWHGYISNIQKEFPVDLDYLDSANYYSLLKDTVDQDSLFYRSSEEIGDIVEIKDDGFVINLKNGESMRFRNENEGSEDENIFKFYGFIPSKEYVLVRNFHWEEAICFMIDINNGQKKILKNGLDKPEVSPDARYIAGNYSTMDESGALIYDISGEPKVLYQSSFTYFQNLNWINNESFIHGSQKAHYGKVIIK